MPGRRWSDLSERNRRLILVGGAVEAVLKVLALVDIARRPAAQIRGRKWVWATVVTLLNAMGGAPLAYFLVGRTKDR
jgi:hypothetical protein